MESFAVKNLTDSLKSKRNQSIYNEMYPNFLVLNESFEKPSVYRISGILSLKVAQKRCYPLLQQLLKDQTIDYQTYHAFPFPPF